MVILKSLSLGDCEDAIAAILKSNKYQGLARKKFLLESGNILALKCGSPSSSEKSIVTNHCQGCFIDIGLSQKPYCDVCFEKVNFMMTNSADT